MPQTRRFLANGREAAAYVQSLRLKGRRGRVHAASKLSGHPLGTLRGRWKEGLSFPIMTKANFHLALVFTCLVWVSSLYAVEDEVFQEAQEAILKTLDLPFGVSGQQTIHIRLKSKGEFETYEFWNPKLQMSLSEAEPLSVADKLNGQEQALWQGEAVLTAGAYRVLMNSDSLGTGQKKYQRWKEAPSTFGKDAFAGFTLLKTAQGWKVNPAKRGVTSSSEPPYEKEVLLSTEPAKSPVTACFESEVESAFRQLIHSQTNDGFILVERSLPEFSDFVNVDKHHEFHTPSLQFEMLPLTTAQALNGDAMAAVRVDCQAHRFPKKVKSKTAKTPSQLPQTIPMWKGEDPGLKWESGPSPDMKQKGSCDYIGIRRDGKWTFTISGFLVNPDWLEKIVLISEAELPRPEDELPVDGNPVMRPLIGIGAALAVKNGFVEITSLVAGGPADQSGELKVGDRIIAIGVDDPPSIWGRIEILNMDDSDNPENNYQLSDIIKQIRGEAGTAVHLKIQPAGSNDPAQIKAVKIIRAEIKAK